MLEYIRYIFMRFYIIDGCHIAAATATRVTRALPRLPPRLLMRDSHAMPIRQRFIFLPSLRLPYARCHVAAAVIAYL